MRRKLRLILAEEVVKTMITDHAADRIRERGFSPIWVRKQLASRPFASGTHKWILPGTKDTIVYTDERPKPSRNKRRVVITVYHDE
jgi:hypothetical protein